MSTSIVVAYPFTPDQVRARTADLALHTFATPTAYRDGVKAIAVCREMRVLIEERRKLLKQDSLEYGRNVDRVAGELTAIIEAVEKPLKLAKAEVDGAKERAKREAEAAERKAFEDQVRAARAAEEEALREKRKAEEAVLAEQRRQLEVERKAAAAERSALQAERDAAAQELAEIRARKAAEAQERAARELAERQLAEAEERRINALEAEQARAKRIAALAPDHAKLNAFADTLRTAIFDAQTPESESAVEAMTEAITRVEQAIGHLRGWAP